MTYDSPQALRMALEHRLRTRSEKWAIGIDRLRRRVLVERIVARLQAAEPGRWVLKGGMALEARLRDDARLTKDVDLGLRFATKRVWAERDGSAPPAKFPALPESWPDRYESLAVDLGLDTRSFPAAAALIDQLWAEMFGVDQT